jgi:hypothetical protein
MMRKDGIEVQPACKRLNETRCTWTLDIALETHDGDLDHMTGLPQLRIQ